MVDAATDSKSAGISCPLCGGTFKTDIDLPNGTEINGFVIEDEIGRGGMGIVYLANQVTLKRYVALKTLSDSLAQDLNFVEGFFREARSAASINHPNIVQAYDAGITDDGVCYFVMELIEGENLDNLVTRKGALDVATALTVAEKISAAMAYAWDRQKLCHGDIKPENIILKPNGDVKLADLGLAKSYMEGTTEEHDIMATPLYAAPEQIRFERDKIGFRTDMYSFGATLYHLFIGQPPFPGTDPEKICDLQLNSQARSLAGINPDIPAQISILVDKLLEKQIEKRPKNWHDVHKVISDVIEKRNVAKREKQKQAENSTGHSRLIVLFISIISLLLLAVGGMLVYLLLTDSDKDLKTEEAPHDDNEKENRDELMDRIGAMSLTDAIIELERYVTEAPEGQTDEPKRVLSYLKKQQSQEAEIKDIRSAVAALANTMENFNISTEKDISILRNKQKELQNLINRYSKKETEYLATSLSKERKDFLLSKRNEISKRILQLEKEANSKAMAEKARLEKIHLEEQRKNELEIENYRKILAMQTKAADSIINIMEPFTNKNVNTASLLEALRAWEKEFPEARHEDRALVKNLIRFFNRLDISHFWKILNKNETILKGLPLLPISMPGYVFESTNDKTIKISFLDGKVTVGKRVPWSSLREDELRQMILIIMRSEQALRMDVNYRELLIDHYMLISKDYVATKRFYTRLNLNNDTLSLKLHPFFSSLTKETTALKFWNALRSNEAAPETQTEIARTLKNDYHETDVFKRHKDEIIKILEKNKH